MNNPENKIIFTSDTDLLDTLAKEFVKSYYDRVQNFAETALKRALELHKN